MRPAVRDKYFSNITWSSLIFFAGISVYSFHADYFIQTKLNQIATLAFTANLNVPVYHTSNVSLFTL